MKYEITVKILLISNGKPILQQKDWVRQMVDLHPTQISTVNEILIGYVREPIDHLMQLTEIALPQKRQNGRIQKFFLVLLSVLKLNSSH